jgi:hypothetical protein
MSIREVKEGQQGQGVREGIAHTIDTTPWGGTPSGLLVKAYDITAGARTDVSTTVLTGAGSILANVITLPRLSALTVGKLYRVEVDFTIGGNALGCFFEKLAEQ